MKVTARLRKRTTMWMPSILVVGGLLLGRVVGLRYDHAFDPHGDIALEGLVGIGVPF